jgi:predicted nicotinamide N-methyase
VLSEVHQECLWPPEDAGILTSRFRTMDGTELIRIQHSMATPLSHVGLQVWRGALLLADYMLHPGTSPSLAGCSVLELGAGPGLAGLVLAKLARLVFLTGELGMAAGCSSAA